MAPRGGFDTPPTTVQAGIFPATFTGTCSVRGGSATAIGDVMMLDEAASDAAVASVTTGGTDSIYSNVIAPDAQGTKTGTLCVASAVIADDGRGSFVFEGLVGSVFMIAASGSVAIGSPLVATTAMNLDLVPAAGERYVGKSREAVTTPTSRTLASAWFSGIYGGFGTFVS